MSSGQCYGCAVEFGVFKKEHACKNCGFGFCSKCVSRKLEIPKLNNEKHGVCSKCYNILTGKTKPEPLKWSPPENYKKRVAAYESRKYGGAPAASNTTNRPRKSERDQMEDQYKYYNMTKADIELAKRLERLKDDSDQGVSASGEGKKDPPTRQELEDQLARLRGQDPAQVAKNEGKPFYQPPKRKTQEEELRDLMDEMFDEVQLDNRAPKPEEELASRLSQLKDQEQPKTDSNMANNLNKSSTNLDDQYVMNIPIDSQGNKEKNRDDLDKKTLVEVNKMIEQTARELELDAKKAMDDLAKDKELMERLKVLKEEENKKGETQGVTDQNEVSEDSDEEDEEHTIKKLIKQYLEESKLDEKAEASGSAATHKPHKKSNLPKEEGEHDPDELPWCCLCNADAVLRCYDCDGDLFCTNCFREAHDKYQISEHRTTRYRPPKSAKT